tara:strand:- start:1847 stop:2041 length:195 start_codon:yes stop_codon:yes gene_type:complete
VRAFKQFINLKKEYTMRISRIGMKTMDHYFDEYEAKLNEKAEALRVKWRAERRKEIIKLVKGGK